MESLALGGGFDANVSLNNKLYIPNVFDADPAAPPPMTGTGRLIAWNPKTQKEVWGVDQVGLYNGGLLSTSTGLLMQGDAEGMFSIRDVNNGKALITFNNFPKLPFELIIKTAKITKDQISMEISLFDSRL